MNNHLKITFILVVFVCLAPFANSGVKETKHNFSSSVYSPNAYFLGTQQVCIFCHTPHHANLTYGKLLNHEVNDAQAYNMYSSNTIDMNMSDPHEGSLICLSCHDGTIAINSLNNLPGPETAGNYGTPGGPALDGAGKLTGSSDAFVDTDLSDDHPIGITYNASQDTNFVPKTGNSQLYPDKLLDDGLYVECSSCHNPHDNTYSNFLIESNSDSNLCLRCHIQ
jgi:predicted CXXCH cytochrome family protein